MIFVTVLSVWVHLLWSQFIGVNARTLVWYQINLGHIYMFFSCLSSGRRGKEETRRGREEERKGEG